MGEKYVEKRVRVANFGTMASSSQLLVAVPSSRGATMRLHRLAAEQFEKMAAAVKNDLKLELKIASGWRPHRWKSRQEYEAKLIAKYGSVAAGRKWLAFDSPHETGLAMDIGVGGLEPNRKTRDAQRKTKLHAWLVEHAHNYGWHPYKAEPWHWECPLGRKSWESGERVDDADEALSFGLTDEYEEDEAIEDDFDDDGDE